MPIKNLPTSERPYEKAQIYGLENLSNSELLAIIIKTGTKEKTSVELAQQILSIDAKNKENIQFLQNISIEEFMKIKGVGKVKAIQIKAICELTKRMARPINILQTRLVTAEKVVDLLDNEMKFEKREKMKVLILNSKNYLLKIVDVSYGGTNSATVDPKDILVEPIKMEAPRIILVHNHPSGDPTPSKEDITLTESVFKGAAMLGIELVDHIVLGHDKYVKIVPEYREEWSQK